MTQAKIQLSKLEDYPTSIKKYGGGWLWSITFPVEETPPGKAPNIPLERGSWTFFKWAAKWAVHRNIKRILKEETRYV